MHDRAYGELVRRRRQELGLRQDEVAALAGVGVRSVHAVEAGKPTIRLDVLTAIASVLGIDLVMSTPTVATSLIHDEGAGRDT